MPDRNLTVPINLITKKHRHLCSGAQSWNAKEEALQKREEWDPRSEMEAQRRHAAQTVKNGGEPQEAAEQIGPSEPHWATILWFDMEPKGPTE
jgi:hypothetical protein